MSNLSANEISYDGFYKDYGYEYLLQGDILLEIRTANWKPDEAVYEKSYIDGLVLSNTCDISFDNNRNVNPKQCLFAPILDLQDYLNDLIAEGYTEQKVSDFKKMLLHRFIQIFSISLKLKRVISNV